MFCGCSPPRLVGFTGAVPEDSKKPAKEKKAKKDSKSQPTVPLLETQLPTAEAAVANMDQWISDLIREVANARTAAYKAEGMKFGGESGPWTVEA